MAKKNAETTDGGKNKKLIAIVAVIAIAAGWYFYVGKSAPSDAVEEHVAGEVFPLDPIQVNLAGGHYLRIGVALQMEEGAHEVSGAQALDSTISIFSGRSVSDINNAETRNKLKAALLKELKVRYDGELMDVFLTDYVSQ